jgi:translocation and assembly module TamB
VVIVGGPGAVEERQDRELSARVRLVLGEDVDVDVLGLKAKPRGSILVVDRPGQATRGFGELELREGTFKAYGQDLTIERGRLVFAGGPIVNPGVDVRAFRRADDGVVAGVEVEGTLREPQLTVWSEPPMDESEALAYVLLGRPLDRATPAEGSMVANAATSLGLRGGNLLAKKLAARFGLEEARIESDGGYEQASLVLGKYLSPRLYVSYGMGLFEAMSTLRVRYLLDRHWTVMAETGQGVSAEVRYVVERGRGGKTPDPGKVGADDVPAVTDAETGSGGGSGR